MEICITNVSNIHAILLKKCKVLLPNIKQQLVTLNARFDNVVVIIWIRSRMALICFTHGPEHFYIMLYLMIILLKP